MYRDACLDACLLACTLTWVHACTHTQIYLLGIAVVAQELHIEGFFLSSTSFLYFFLALERPSINFAATKCIENETPAAGRFQGLNVPDTVWLRGGGTKNKKISDPLSIHNSFLLGLLDVTANEGKKAKHCNSHSPWTLHRPQLWKGMKPEHYPLLPVHNSSPLPSKCLKQRCCLSHPAGAVYGQSQLRRFWEKAKWRGKERAMKKRKQGKNIPCIGKWNLIDSSAHECDHTFDRNPSLLLVGNCIFILWLSVFADTFQHKTRDNTHHWTAEFILRNVTFSYEDALFASAAGSSKMAGMFPQSSKTKSKMHNGTKNSFVLQISAHCTRKEKRKRGGFPPRHIFNLLSPADAWDLVCQEEDSCPPAEQGNSHSLEGNCYSIFACM